MRPGKTDPGAIRCIDNGPHRIASIETTKMAAINISS